MGVVGEPMTTVGGHGQLPLRGGPLWQRPISLATARSLQLAGCSWEGLKMKRKLPFRGIIVRCVGMYKYL